jgi:penicillin-binding protein-related factor A (putative recombinase)
MAKSNKAIGTQVEKEFAYKMHRAGWWVHLLADKIHGQPFDCIMSNHGVTWFLDIKNVQHGDTFSLARIEENQINAMVMLWQTGARTVGFAIKFEDGWYILKLEQINFNTKYATKSEMKRLEEIFTF